MRRGLKLPECQLTQRYSYHLSATRTVLSRGSGTVDNVMKTESYVFTRFPLLTLVAPFGTGWLQRVCTVMDISIAFEKIDFDSLSDIHESLFVLYRHLCAFYLNLWLTMHEGHLRNNKTLHHFTNGCKQGWKVNVSVIDMKAIIQNVPCKIQA